MGRLIHRGLVFLALALVLYLLAFFALTRIRFHGRPVIYRTGDYYQWKGGVVHLKMKEWDPAARWDAIVIGSSHAYRGYDPTVFAQRGYRMFNLGSTAQTPLSSFSVLKHYVDSPTTRLVIMDLYENAFEQDGAESVSDLTQNLSSDAAAAELAWDYGDLRGLNMFTLRMMNRNGPPLYGDKHYRGLGFSVKPDSLTHAVAYDRGRPLVLAPKQLRYLGRCMDLCAARGITVVLSTHYYPHGSDHARHAAFAHAIDSLTAGRDVRWFDLAYAHQLSDTDHFSDRNHLNAAGARAFTAQLLDSLVTDGYLKKR